MSKDELYQALKTGLVDITFTKKDGTERTITGTLVEDYLPPKNPDAKKVNRSEDMISVWSTKDGGWRGFSFDQIKSWTPVAF
jgi:hypothetical protein